MSGVERVASEIDHLTQRCGVQITQSYIDALAASMREFGASEVFIQVMQQALDDYGHSTDTDKSRTK